MHSSLLRGCRRKVGLTWMRGLLCVAGFVAGWALSDSIIKTLGKTYVHVRDESGVQLRTHGLYTDDQSAIRPADSFVNESYLETNANISATPSVIYSEEFLQLREEIVTPQDFPFLIPGREVCSNVSRLQLIVLVLSVHAEGYVRRAIRDTWGSYMYMYKGVSMRLAFLLGAPPSPDLNTMVQKEAIRHGDIVMADFKETYTHISFKVLMGLRWAALHCSQAEFIVRTDSDMYNKIPLIVDIIEKYPPTANGTIYGDGHEHTGQSLVLRKGKWGVDRDMYPLDTFPPYIAGACYVMSARLAMPIYEASKYFPFLSIEDALVTGILASKVGATLKNIPTFVKWSYYSACPFLKDDKWVVLTTVNPPRMYDIWSIQLAYSTVCHSNTTYPANMTISEQYLD